MLQLANNGNLIIVRGSDTRTFQLRLASLEKKHAHFEDYRAPSFLQTKVRRICHMPVSDSLLRSFYARHVQSC